MSSMIGSSGYKGATGSASGQNMTGNVLPKGSRAGQMQQFSPEQMQLFQQLFGNLGPDSFLGKLAGGDQSTFEQLEAPAMQQFQGLQGQLASRFSQGGGGPGAMSARKSSGFQNTTNQAASDFAQQLQSQRMGLQRQAMGDLMGFSNQLLNQRPYEQFFINKQQPWWQKLILGANEKGQQLAPVFAKAAMGGF